MSKKKKKDLFFKGESKILDESTYFTDITSEETRKYIEESSQQNKETLINEQFDKADVRGFSDKTEEEIVEYEGWICNKRTIGNNLIFIILRTGSRYIQAVATPNEISNPADFESLSSASIECSCRIKGITRFDKRAPGLGKSIYEISSSYDNMLDRQIIADSTSANNIVRFIIEEPSKSNIRIKWELLIKEFTLIGPSTPDYPVQPKGRGEEAHGVDYLLEHRHLWLRTERQWAILRLRDRAIFHLRLFLDAEGYACVDSPIITANACEGTSTLFRLEYFDRAAYLSQSGQLYSEATCQALGRVYCFGPTFRAEKSFTRKHLTEFWMLEPEAAFLTHEENIALQERMVKHVAGKVLDKSADLIEKIHDPKGLDFVKGEETAAEVVGRLEAARDEPFARLTYDAALEKLKEAGEPLEWGEDFGAPHETALGGLYDVPVFIERWPAEAKAFYMEPDPDDDRYVQCDDLIASGGFGELIGGSIRAHDPELLERRIAEHGLDREAFGWYLDVRRYGAVPHGGFGLGLERFVQWLGGVHHIREVIPFPRTIKRLEP